MLQMFLRFHGHLRALRHREGRQWALTVGPMAASLRAFNLARRKGRFWTVVVVVLSPVLSSSTGHDLGTVGDCAIFLGIFSSTLNFMIFDSQISISAGSVLNNPKLPM
jgi:hypothetical protein